MSLPFFHVKQSAYKIEVSKVSDDETIHHDQTELKMPQQLSFNNEHMKSSFLGMQSFA